MVVAINIKNNPVVANTKTILSQSKVGEWFGKV